MVYPYDLHVHSTNSDGRLTPKEVLDRAQTNGLKALIFTDHSGITYGDDLVKQASEFAIELPFPGTELSTFFEGRKHHIVAYGPGLANSVFRNYAAFPSRRKNELFADIIYAIQEMGYAIPTPDAILKGSQPDGSYLYPTRWMLSRSAIATYLALELNCSQAEARAMFAKSDCPKKRSIFINETRPESERYLDTVDAIRRVLDHGGVPVLAHPFWWAKRGIGLIETLFQQMEHFVAAGLLGVEVRNALVESDPTLYEQLLNWAQERKLLVTGGSDFHAKPDRPDLGYYGVTEREFASLQDAVMSRRTV